MPLLVLAACGDDPINYSDQVVLNLKGDADKVNVSTNVLTDEKNITTESGNPYGAFVNDARGALGHDPSRIEVESVSLLLGAASEVASLGAVWDGQVDVLFVMDTSENSYPVASAIVDEEVTDGGPAELEVTFDPDTVSDVDLAKFIAGSFKVVLRGTVQQSFADSTAKTEQQVSLTFAAYE